MQTKKKNLGITTFTKFNSMWVTNLNVKYKIFTIKLDKSLYDPKSGDELPDKMPKTIKE